MDNQAEDLYIVVGAAGKTGAAYRQALSRLPGVCIGLARGTDIHWDRHDRNLLWVDLCRTYDDNLRQALCSFIAAHTVLPARVTVLFAAGRDGGNNGSFKAERRRQPDMPCFNALALKNIVSMLEEILETRAAKKQKTVALRVAALTTAASPKATMEAFVSKFVAGHDREAHPYLAKSGLVARTDAGIPPETLVTATLPRIHALNNGEHVVLDVLKSESQRPWRSPSGINGLPDEAQLQNMLRDRQGMPRNLWSNVIRTRRWREAAETHAGTRG